MYSSFSSAVLAVSIVFPLLALCAVAARVCARKVKQKKLGADDWVIIDLVRITVYTEPSLELYIDVFRLSCLVWVP